MVGVAVPNRNQDKPAAKAVAGNNDISGAEDKPPKVTKKGPSSRVGPSMDVSEESDMPVKDPTAQEALVDQCPTPIKTPTNNQDRSGPNNNSLEFTAINAEQESSQKSAGMDSHSHFDEDGAETAEMYHKKRWNNAENAVIRQCLFDLNDKTEDGRSLMASVLERCNKLRNNGSPVVTSQQLHDKIHNERTRGKFEKRKREDTAESSAEASTQSSPTTADSNAGNLSLGVHRACNISNDTKHRRTQSTRNATQGPTLLDATHAAENVAHTEDANLTNLIFENENLHRAVQVLIDERDKLTREINTSKNTVTGLQQELTIAKEKVSSIEALSKGMPQEIKNALCELVLQPIDGKELRRKILALLIQ